MEAGAFHEISEWSGKEKSAAHYNAQFEGAMLVAKLRVARERKGKLGGRKPVPQPIKDRARNLRNQGLTLRAISARLADEGVRGPSGKLYFLRSVQLMLEDCATRIGHSLIMLRSSTFLCVVGIS